MLNELPKKEKPKKPLTKWRLFWRVQKVCLLRSITPMMMYLFTSLIGLACQAIAEGTQVYEVILGIVCIVAGAAFNVPMGYLVGKNHYDSYLTGCIHRRNAVFGIKSGGDHRPEQEYRWWKGFLIGFYVGVPVIIMGIFAAIPATWTGGELALVMFAGWAIFPVQWLRTFLFPNWASDAYPAISGGLSILMILLPVLVTGVSYIVGAMAERSAKQKEEERNERVLRAGIKRKQ